MMKKLLYLFLLSSSTMFSQITVFEDSFDTYPNFGITGFGGWQVLDVDLLNTYGVGTGITWTNNGAPQAFMVFDPTATTPAVTNATNGVAGATENRNFNPRTGAKYAACWDAVPAGALTANEDWLISPPIDLTGATGSSLSVWVKSLSDTYGLERYRIGVSIGSTAPTTSAGFTIISGVANLLAPYGTWAERVQSLTTYDGQIIRIGIQCRSADAYMFMVDDFKITATTLKNPSFESLKLSVYPNPANDVLNIVNENNLELSSISVSDLNGRTIIKENSAISQLNISELNSGVYFVNILTSDGTNATKKFIKL